ncbi:putative indole-3-pyruvate monooxygenase YUCCA10 [Bidens hawaiensis]|uniref:putative indole-3-pyruvate monooxygenase YUCCA10 n=1 Tax=Bidens hawaiensis TaxID=980011 RepID=UPI00404B3472
MEDWYASLWQKKAYDRLKLHLAKKFCQLPHMAFLLSTPTFVSKNMFVQYLQNHVYHFNIDPLYQSSVESARYDGSTQKWVVTAKNSVLGLVEEYVGEFLVVATGENSEGYIPNIYGLDNFKGLVIHSSGYENRKKFGNEKVLVVGAGNSGMEIAYDLCNWGAQTSIVIRSPTHVLTKGLVQLGIYGIQRPRKGPFSLQKDTGRSPVIDVGTISNIKAGEIEDKQYDAIVFAIGFKSTVRKWLKDDGGLFNEKGMPMHKSPNHWKGEYGLYCVGFASAGLFGISNDAKNIVKDISKLVRGTN